jgi:hypothetical protein
MPKSDKVFQTGRKTTSRDDLPKNKKQAPMNFVIRFRRSLLDTKSQRTIVVLIESCDLIE